MLRILDGVLALGQHADRRGYLLQTVGDLIEAALPAPLARTFGDYELERASEDSDFLRLLRRTVTRRRPH